MRAALLEGVSEVCYASVAHRTMRQRDGQRVTTLADRSACASGLAACKALGMPSKILTNAAAMIQAQIYREWGVAIVKGRAECLTGR